MSLSDRIAVTALVVSLVALVTSTAQTILSFLATADGYRRTGKYVIGEWSKFRNRHFNFSEFRYEVQYVTPQIALMTHSELTDAVDGGFETVVLTSRELKEHQILYNTVHPLHTRVTNGPSPVLPEKGSNVSAKSLLERSHNRGHSEMLVSWLRLLKELHGLYYSYWPHDCDQCSSREKTSPLMEATAWPDAERGLVASDHTITTVSSSNSQPTSSNSDRTDIAVHFRSWTWDFMPPDAIKPLAESTIGDIVVLAQRLGMKWRSLNLDDGIMQADGNGFALNATETKGLGMVFKFSAVGKIDKFPRIVPSMAADKLLCGLLPGDPVLVGADFNLVGNDREALLSHQEGGLFDKLGIAKIIIRAMKETYLPLFQNEPLMLLMPFLPQRDSNIVTVEIRGMLDGRRSIFSFWEGRYALLQALRHRVEHLPGEGSMFEVKLKEVLGHFEDMEKYHGDFYIKFEQADITSQREMPDGSWEDDPTGKGKKAMVEECRKKFDWITKQFLDAGLGQSSGDRTLYMTLVAAHTRLMSGICRPIYETEYKSGRYPSQSRLTTHYTTNFPWITETCRGHYINPEEIEYVKSCAMDFETGIRHPDHGICAFFARRGATFEKTVLGKDGVNDGDQCELFWWMLMLRGMVWTMSCRQYEGEYSVPPIFYGNKTPIWIT